MIGSALQLEDLQAITGYSRVADIERYLERERIPFKRSRTGIWTTMEAINAALGVRPAANEASQYDPDDIA